MVAGRAYSVRMLLAMVLVLFAAAGCSFGNEEAAPDSTATRTDEATPGQDAKRITAAESRWMRHLTKYNGRVEQKLLDVTYRTQGVMLAFASLLRDCRPAIVREGAPSKRVRPAYEHAARACKRFRRAARLFDDAAVALGGSDAEAQMRTVDAAFQALGKGRSQLAAARRRVRTIRASAPGSP
jgi:hypothetical protein